MFDSPGIPKGLAEIPPGPMLAGILASLDRDAISGHDRVLLMRARSRQLAYDQAEFQADIFSVSEAIDELWGESDDPEARFDVTVSEVSTALHWTRRGAESQVGLALQLAADYPRVLQALREGSLDLARARVICDQTSHLEPELRTRVVDQALETASGLTTGQLRARLARLVISVDPDTAEQRYREGLEQRRVVVDANPDGTANLCGWSLPTAQTQAVMRKVNRIARRLKTRDEVRSIDQLRADVFLDLLQGRAQGRRGSDRGVVDLKVDLTTLAGLDDNPGEIPGWGPVIADIARQVTREQESSEWRITITDPDGQPVMVTTTRRRPTTFQKRLVEARNPTCVFPGDRTPAASCDLDHRHPWAEGGPTTSHNLAPCCRHHHQLKDHGWKLEMIKPGTYQWTSPLGHTYTVGPDPP